MKKFRVLAMDDISTDAFSRERVAPGAKPKIIKALDEEDAYEKAAALFPMSHDFIKVDEVL